jgi:23S rRNA U2552 (ribose-2'-O)-methylase RlmE/FtsJ
MQRTYVPWEDNQFVTIDITDIQTQEPFFIQEGWKEMEHPAVITCKNSIANIENADEWDLRKKIMNPYEAVFSGDDGSFPSLVRLQPLSRSYFKMIEMLEHSDFWKDLQQTSSQPFISAHICEGPGGFVQATIEHLVKQKIPVKGVYAMTLKPTNHNIPGWKKSFSFLQRHRQVQIHYGADGTGDVYKAENQASYIAEVGKLGGAHIFTADGGFDFSNDYTLQEMQIFHLLLSSTTTGLRVLRPGGFFVLKLFECTAPHTKLFVLLLSRCFQSWTLYKPAMTRPCNSERYFLGMGLRTNVNSGNSLKAITEALIHMEQQALKGLYPTADLAAIFTDAEVAYLERHNKGAVALQIQYIKNAIYLAKHPGVWKAECYEEVLSKSYEWCEFFGVYAKPRAQP